MLRTIIIAQILVDARYIGTTKVDSIRVVCVYFIHRYIAIAFCVKFIGSSCVARELLCACTIHIDLLRYYRCLNGAMNIKSSPITMCSVDGIDFLRAKNV